MSSGRPPAAIAIVRISGPDALTAARTLAGPLPPPRQAGLRALRDGDGELLDRALVLAFPGLASATGEDLVELHCHGGRAVVEAVERALCAVPGVRSAEAGEFTRRALLNGRIDLTEAEGLADLLEAETEQQRRSAMAAAEGQVSCALLEWLERIALLSAQVEASIDYAEEGDVEQHALSLHIVAAAQQQLADDMAKVLKVPPVERWRDGFRVVIAGPPNAGKSTLVNLLGARDAAIVSPVAGTTRDRIEVAVRRRGVAYVLTDTAGLHDDSYDTIERIGMERSRAAIDAADLVIWLSDDPPPIPAIWVWGKADLPLRGQAPAACQAVVSAESLDSVEALWRLIEAEQTQLMGGQDFALSQRLVDLCRSAHQHLADGSDDILVRAEQLRLAHRVLAEASGVDATDAMLDALFSRFCVGK